MEEAKTTIKKSVSVVKDDLREKTSGYIMTALGLVAGLAWNDAITSFIKIYFPLEGDGVTVKFIYAILITVIIVLISRSLIKVLGPKDK